MSVGLEGPDLWRHRRLVIARPVQLQGVDARVGERQALLVVLAAGMRGGDAGIFGAGIVDDALARLA